VWTLQDNWTNQCKKFEDTAVLCYTCIPSIVSVTFYSNIVTVATGLHPDEGG